MCLEAGCLDYLVLTIEDVHVIPSVDAHSAETARDPSIRQGQLGPVRIDLVPRDLLWLGLDRIDDTDRHHDQRTRSLDR